MATVQNRTISTLLLALLLLLRPMTGPAVASPSTNLTDSTAYHRDWHVEEAPYRAVFLGDGAHQATIVLPSKAPDGTSLHDVAAFSDDSPLPAKLIDRNDEKLTAIVEMSSITTPGREIALYALPSPAAERPSVSDEGNVRFKISRSGVFEAPPTVADMVAMADGRPPHRVLEFDLSTVGHVKSEDQEKKNRWHRGKRGRQTYLAEFSGLLKVPESGEYRFFAAERSMGPVYLLIDGTVVIDQPRRGKAPIDDRPEHVPSHPGPVGRSILVNSSSPIRWIPGGKLHLDKGVVAYRALTFAKDFCEITLGWLPPSRPAESDPEAIPDDAWVAAFPPRSARLDRRDAPCLSTAIELTARKGLSYRFNEDKTIFLPVSFRSLHPKNSPAATRDYSPECIWTLFGDAHASPRTFAGEKGDAVAAWGGAPAKAPSLRLLVRDTASYASAQAEKEIPFPERAALRYRVSAGLKAIPPFCYGDDIIRPELIAHTTLPNGKRLHLRATMHHLSPGREASSAEREVILSDHWGRFILPACRAADLSAIEWEVRHEGHVIASGETHFEQGPFVRAPDGAKGDFLLHEGIPIVFVSHWTRDGTAPALPPLPDHPAIVLVDGFATPAGGFGEIAFDRFSCLLRSAGASTVRRHDASGFRRGDGLAMSPRGLILAANLSSVEKPDLLVLAPDFSEVANGAPVEEFERHLAALAGIACNALLIPTVLMTPPPALLSTVSREETPLIRPYAEAVHRVADAYGLPVADLYTLCLTRAISATAPDGTLTAKGAELAGEAVLKHLGR